jgi:hypothetical protein
MLTVSWTTHGDDHANAGSATSLTEASLDNKSCSDVLRLLVSEAATTNDDSIREKRLSTLLLLANHPEVGLDSFTDDSMACCNIEVGLVALVK